MKIARPGPKMTERLTFLLRAGGEAPAGAAYLPPLVVVVMPAPVDDV